MRGHDVDWEPDGAALRVIYNTLIGMIEAQGNWYWNRWQFMLLGNSLLFTAAGIFAKTDSGINWETVPCFSAAGFLLSLAWHLLAVHGGYFYDMRIRQAREIEERLGHHAFGVFTRGAQIGHEGRKGACATLYTHSAPRAELQPPWTWRHFGLAGVYAKTLTATVVPTVFAILWLFLGGYAVARLGWVAQSPEWFGLFAIMAFALILASCATSRALVRNEWRSALVGGLIVGLALYVCHTIYVTP